MRSNLDYLGLERDVGYKDSYFSMLFNFVILVSFVLILLFHPPFRDCISQVDISKKYTDEFMHYRPQNCKIIQTDWGKVWYGRARAKTRYQSVLHAAAGKSFWWSPDRMKWHLCDGNSTKVALYVPGDCYWENIGHFTAECMLMIGRIVSRFNVSKLVMDVSFEPLNENITYGRFSMNHTLARNLAYLLGSLTGNETVLYHSLSRSIVKPAKHSILAKSLVVGFGQENQNYWRQPQYTPVWSVVAKSVLKGFNIPSKADDGPRQIIYITRRNAPRRRIRNEQELIDAIRKTIASDGRNINLDIYDPGKHSIWDQIRVFHQADIVVIERGAALVLCMYMKPGSTVIFSAGNAKQQNMVPLNYGVNILATSSIPHYFNRNETLGINVTMVIKEFQVALNMMDSKDKISVRVSNKLKK